MAYPDARLQGTSYYIAVEVQGSDYSFDSGEADTPSPALDCFAFNPYHDLESSLWMALEFVIRRAPRTVIDAKVSGRPVKEILQEHAEKMFVPRAEGAPNRYAYLTKPRQTKALRADLRRIYGESHPVPKLLDCTLALREAYREVEDSDASSCIHLENGRWHCLSCPFTTR